VEDQVLEVLFQITVKLGLLAQEMHQGILLDSFGHKEGRSAQLNFDVSRSVPVVNENRSIKIAIYITI
jgi:hypothetical protein